MILSLGCCSTKSVNFVPKCKKYENTVFRNQLSVESDYSKKRDLAIIDYFEYKKKNETELKNLSYLALLAPLIALPAIFLSSKSSKTNKVCDRVEKNFSKFISLKNDRNVPTLYDCNSIDKKLKYLLQNQIDFTKATPEDMKKVGMPKSPNRLILYGAPGSGKSYFAKIFAKTLDADYKEIKYSDLNSRWVGEHLDNMSKCFDGIIEEASANSDKRYVVTFNEIDSLVLPIERMSSGLGGHSIFKVEERSVFLNYLDEVAEKVPNVTIIGTTNVTPKNNSLDGAAMSRFMNIIEVSYPNNECLSEALKMHISKLENGDKFIKLHEKELDEFSNSLVKRKASFRDLNNIVNNSKNYYLKDTLKDKNSKFKMEYLIRSRDSIDLMDGEIAGVV